MLEEPTQENAHGRMDIQISRCRYANATDTVLGNENGTKEMNRKFDKEYSDDNVCHEGMLKRAWQRGLASWPCR